MNTAQKGRAGEDLAVVFFEKSGYRVVARNFRRGRGEIDLIVKKNDEIAFVEVKHWTTYSEENIEYGVNADKKRRIMGASKAFSAENPEFDGCRLRFDVLYIPRTGEKAVHLIDAFGEEM